MDSFSPTQRWLSAGGKASTTAWLWPRPAYPSPLFPLLGRSTPTSTSLHRHHELWGMSFLGGWYSDLTSEVLLKENSTWSQGPDLPDPLDSACALPLDGNNFVTIGGGRRHSTVSKYDTATETWDQTWPQLPEGRRGHSCARLGSILVVAGGFSFRTFQYTDSTLTINADTGISILQLCTMYSENSILTQNRIHCTG